MEKKPKYYTYFSIEFGKINCHFGCSNEKAVKNDGVTVKSITMKLGYKKILC